MTREERLDWLCRLRGQLIYFNMPDHWRTNYTHALSDEINDLQQEPCCVQSNKWIPVSERLPEEETDVLICNKQGEIEISQGSRSTEVDTFIWYTSGWRFGEVIAWQPLPEPYKEERNDEVMTNEEAKDYIREWCPYDRQEEIIKALNNSDEDCISRQAVLDIDFKRIILTTAKPAETIEQKVKALPPVSPQPKTGHWVHGEYCSECGCDVPAYISDWKWQMDMDAKYCPNCGAKMEKKEKNNG